MLPQAIGKAADTAMVYRQRDSALRQSKRGLIVQTSP
jgi:hypothetical protein